MQVQIYLHFNGQCEQALDFYKQVLGAEVLYSMRFKDAPDQSMVPPGSGEQIMHASLRIGTTELMASDGAQEVPAGFSLTIPLEDVARAEQVFAALAEGGQVKMPLGETFWAERFGMLTDKFGIPWMVNVSKPMPN